MKKIIISILVSCLTIVSWAQDFEDVLRYSQSYQTGNARYSAMAGAFGSLGANISALVLIPPEVLYFEVLCSIFSGIYTN